MRCEGHTRNVRGAHAVRVKCVEAYRLPIECTGVSSITPGLTRRPKHQFSTHFVRPEQHLA
jgi:hypothetical protein